MVSQGNFTLRLINARTMKPLQEHSSSTGKTYVTLASNTDFMVQLEAPQEERNIFYQTFVSNSATSSKHNFKTRSRPQQLMNGDDKPNIYRFDRAAATTTTPSTSSYESVVMEKVTVRIYEATPNDDKRKLRHLETIALHCCVLPTFRRPTIGDRATSLRSLMAAATTNPHHRPPTSPCCFLKKNPTTTSPLATTTRSPLTAKLSSRLVPEKMMMRLPAPPLVL